MDVHIQFIGTYEGVEGDSASIAIATAVLSAIQGIPVDQSVAMTGSLSVRGDVLPVGGVTYKIEAAARAGIKTEIIPVINIEEVLEYSLVGREKESLISTLKKLVMRTKFNIPLPETRPITVL